MADGEVSIKATGNASDAERALAVLEKKYSDLESRISGAATKARSAAEAQKQASREQANAIAADANQSRKVLQDTLRALKAADGQETTSDRTKRNQKLKAMAIEASETRAVSNTTLRLVKSLDANEIESDRAKRRAKIIAARQEAREKRQIERDQAKAGQSVERWAQGVAGMATSYFGISSIVGSIVSQHDEMIEKAKEHGNQMDENARKLRVLAGFDKNTSANVQQEIKAIAVSNSTTVENANAAAMGLSTVGFDQKELTKGADFVLKLQAANNELGNDPQQLVEDASKLMAARGLDMTVENLKKTMIPLQALGKPTSLKLSDTSQFASKSVGLSAAIKNEYEENAIQAMAIRYARADKSSTTAQAFVDRLTGAGGDKERIGELSKLKITDKKTGKQRPMTPEDVDFKGETLPEVLKSLDEGIKGHEAAGGNSDVFYQRFFGIEHGSVSRALIRDRKKLPELVAVQKNSKTFEEDAETNQSGFAAAERRFQTVKAIDQGEKHDHRQMMLDELARLNVKHKGWLLGGAQNSYRRVGAEVDNGLGSFDTALEKMVDFWGKNGEPRILEAYQNVQGYNGKEPLVGVGGKYFKKFQKQAQERGEVVPDVVAPVIATPEQPAGMIKATDAAGPRKLRSASPFLSRDERDEANRIRDEKYRGVPVSDGSRATAGWITPQPLNVPTDDAGASPDSGLSDEQARYSGGRSLIGDAIQAQNAEVKLQSALLVEQNKHLAQIATLLQDRKPASGAPTPTRRAKPINASEVG